MTILQPFDPFLFTFSYQQDTYVLLSNKPVTFAPLPYPSSKRPPLLDYQLEAGAGLGTAKNKTRGLSSSSIANFTGRIRLISLSLHSEHYLQNMPLHPSSFPSLSVSRYDISTNTGTTACLHCSCLSCWNVQSCGSEYERSRSSVQCQSSRIQYNAIMMKKWVKVQIDELLPRDIASLGGCYIHRRNFYIKLQSVRQAH